LKRILFVCSGNTCRSPLAEVIARQLLPPRLDFQVEIASAGASALNGSPASQYALDVARAHGLDLTAHRSRPLSAALVREADLIVTMGNRHRETVGTLEAGALEHTYLLTNFSDHKLGEIPDPIGGDRDTYERTYLVIRECVEAMAQKLRDFDGWKSPARGGQR
jgi:protein-tyrosine-phosphatase